MNKLSKKSILTGMVTTAAFMLPALSQAADGSASKGADLTPLTNAVDFGSVMTGIMAVAGSLIILYAGSAGVKWILRMVRSA